MVVNVFLSRNAWREGLTLPLLTFPGVRGRAERILYAECTLVAKPHPSTRVSIRPNSKTS